MVQSFPPRTRSAGWATGSPPRSSQPYTSPKGWPRPNPPSGPSKGSPPQRWACLPSCATGWPPPSFSPFSATVQIPSNPLLTCQESFLPSGTRSGSGPQTASLVPPPTSWPLKPASLRSTSSSHTNTHWPAKGCYAPPRISTQPPPDYLHPCGRRRYTVMSPTTGPSPVGMREGACPFRGSSRSQPRRTGLTCHWMPSPTQCFSSLAQMASPTSQSPPSTCARNPSLLSPRVTRTLSSSSYAGTYA